MSKPLLMLQRGQTEAQAFHRSVFRYHGRKCYFCGKDATDAMHLVPRSRLGKRQRYACPVENGRPGCRPCHERQERGEIAFRRADMLKAIRALNVIGKVPIPEPAA